MVHFKYVQFIVCELYLNKAAKVKTKIVKMLLTKYTIFEAIR